MADNQLARQLAHSALDALKKAGHIVLAPGGGEQTAREMAQQLEPALPRILAKVVRSPIMGEVSSTFGDEATDELVEELVEELRETVLDSDGVEDVFAEDRAIERVIFLTLRDELRLLGNREADDEAEPPPISVRLDTLGYVAKAAAREAELPTLRDALDRAAMAVQAELDNFDAEAHTAFFRPGDSDPEKRIEIEAAIEEELSDLVDLGVVELPSELRVVPLPALAPEARKGLSRRLDDLAARHLADPLCPGSWDWGAEKTTVVLSFTPLTAPNPALIDSAAAAFGAGLAGLLAELPSAPAAAIEAAESRPARKVATSKPPVASKQDGDDALARRLLAALEAEPALKKKPASKKKAVEPKAAAPKLPKKKA